MRPPDLDREFVAKLMAEVPFVAVQSLLAISGFKYSPNVQSCQIVNIGKPVVFLREGFVRDYCNSFSDIALIVMKEVLRMLFWNMSEKVESFLKEEGINNLSAENLVEIFLQKTLYQIIPSDQKHQIFSKIYGFDPSPVIRMRSGQSAMGTFPWKSLHRAIFSPCSISIEDIAKRMSVLLPVEDPPPGGGGSDNGDGDGEGGGGAGCPNAGESNDDSSTGEDPTEGSQGNQPVELPMGLEILSELKDTVGQNVDSWLEEQREELLKRVATGQIGYEEVDGRIQEFRREAGHSKDTVLLVIDEGAALYRENAQLRKTLLSAGDYSPEAAVRAELGAILNPRVFMSTRPNFRDRRTLIAEVLGVFRPYHKNQRPVEPTGIVRIFWDVSGSVIDLAPMVKRLLRAFRRYTGEHVYVFSNECQKVNLLRGEKIPTTGGTDFDCVARMIKEEGIGVAVVLTDGYASAREKENQEILSKTTIIGLYTDSHYAGGLTPYANKEIVLPKV